MLNLKTKQQTLLSIEKSILSSIAEKCLKNVSGQSLTQLNVYFPKVLKFPAGFQGK